MGAFLLHACAVVGGLAAQLLGRMISEGSKTLPCFMTPQAIMLHQAFVSGVTVAAGRPTRVRARLTAGHWM